MAPNIRKVAVVQTSLLTIHTYPQSSSSGDSSSDSEQEGGERHLELPVHFRKEPQSRLLAWCPQSRYLLLFTGSGCEKGKEDRGTASSESGDLLVLDTDQGEVLGTLSTASLLSTSPTSSSPSSPAASKPAKSTTRVGARAHQASQCVHLFCIDDVKGDTEEEEEEECGGACAVERKVLFQLCLVSAAGRLVVLSCALRSSHSIASLAEGCDESKRQQQPQQEQQREFQLSCTIMAVSTMSGAGAQRQGGEEEGCAVVVDAVAWLPRNRTILMASTSMSAQEGQQQQQQTTRLHVSTCQLVRQSPCRSASRQWQWRQAPSSSCVSTVSVTNNSNSNNSSSSSVSLEQRGDPPQQCEEEEEEEEEAVGAVRALSLCSNSMETVALLLLSSGCLVVLQLGQGGGGGGGVTVSSTSLLTQAALARVWRHGDTPPSPLTAAHFLTEDSVLFVTKEGGVAAAQLGGAGAGAEEGEGGSGWCVQLQHCSVDKLPPALGLCSGHSVLVPMSRGGTVSTNSGTSTSAEENRSGTDESGGVLSRIAVLRAVDSWSCQVK